MLYNALRPLLLSLDAEQAHGLTLKAMKMGLTPRYDVNDPALRVKLWGREFRNPLGLAAGFDKQAEVIAPLFNMGFGFVEAGTVTPLPQAGNPKPRVFRDKANKSVINRMGFPGSGLDVFVENIKKFRDEYADGLGILGVNIGMNKDAKAPLEDYKRGIEKLAAYADYITINISSPNTAGLRDLQAREELDKLLAALVGLRNVMQTEALLLLKVAPDLEAAQREDIAALVIEHRIDGLIVSNTTVTRPAALDAKLKDEKGGLSGQLLSDLATERIADFYKLTQGKLPIVGVGGIATAADAYAKIRAGASLVQVYTALVYEGPALVPNVLAGLVHLMRKDGFNHISEAVGADVKLA